MSRNCSRKTGTNRKEQRTPHVREEQIRLLYQNANTGVTVSLFAASVLAYVQSSVVAYPVVLSWAAYMLVVSAGRWVLSRRYSQVNQKAIATTEWGTAFAIGAGLAGAGWGAAGFCLFPTAEPMHQIFLIFTAGGMMLGGASLLAPRPEAFLAFLIPTGLSPAIRLVFEGDKEHVAMGLLAGIFTAATVTTTWRFYKTIESSLELRFQNDDLMEDLKVANSLTDALNQELERRVQQRTAELNQSNLQLRAEISHREQMEEELVRVRNLESLGVLAGGIAHDFNNFLTVVQGNIELAKLELDEKSTIHEILEDSAKACQRAALLSSQLLTFAKGGDPIRRVVSSDKLILDAVQLARAGAAVNIDIDMAGDLWPFAVDAGQIGQVLHNLLLNAKQAMPEGGAIRVFAENVVLHDEHEPGPGSYVRIAIRDHGTGIPAEILPRVFDPYFTTKRGGNGLGLATAYAIITKHGGHISVSSIIDEGTQFVLLLPASCASPTAELPTAAPLLEGKGRLLVMDDEETLRTLLARSLTKLGYQVESARDGLEAIALYESAKRSGHAFDAVLLDLTISGGMGGAETGAKLKELDPFVKLIVSSGYSDAPVMANYREYGFDDVIQKPWQTAQLGEVLRRVLIVNR